MGSIEKEKGKMSFTELRVIGISLGVLSIGFAIAYFGLFWMMRDGNTATQKSEKVATSSAESK